MKRIIAILMALLLCAAMLPATALAGSTKTVYVSSSGEGTLNLRAGPGLDYAKKGTVSHGDKVTVKKTSGEWSKVAVSGTSKVGWIKTKYINGSLKPKDSGTKTVRTNSGKSVILREGPGSDYKNVGYVKDGAKVKVKETKGSWVKVKVSSTGKIGWIRSSFLTGGSGSSSGRKYSVRSVDNAILNVRTGPGKGYDKLYTLSDGDAMKVLETSGGWYRIETFDGVKGWVAGNLTRSGATATITRSYVNVRKGASQSTQKLGELYKGDKVKVDSVTGSYAHASNSKQTGYIHVNFLDF